MSNNAIDHYDAIVVGAGQAVPAPAVLAAAVKP
jgi:hypothetical protein